MENDFEERRVLPPPNAGVRHSSDEAHENQKTKVSFDRPDRNSVENDLSAEKLVQHFESKWQFQNSEIFIQNYDFQTAQHEEPEIGNVNMKKK